MKKCANIFITFPVSMDKNNTTTRMLENFPTRKLWWGEIVITCTRFKMKRNTILV